MILVFFFFELKKVSSARCVYIVGSDASESVTHNKGTCAEKRERQREVVVGNGNWDLVFS